MLRIRELRARRGISTLDLAMELHVWPGTVLDWESGRIMPRSRNLKALARALDCPIPELFVRDISRVEQRIG